MIKICIYCEKWGSGGIESYLVNMLEQMFNRGFIIDIVTATMTSDLYVSRLNKIGIRIIELSGSPYKITENRSRLHHIFRHEHYCGINDLFEGCRKIPYCSPNSTQP